MRKDMEDMCRRRGIRIPQMRIDYRGRRMYKAVCDDSFQFVAAAADMHAHGMKPTVQIGFATETVEMIERKSGETWVVKYYAKNKNQAESVMNDAFVALNTGTEQQDEFTF